MWLWLHPGVQLFPNVNMMGSKNINNLELVKDILLDYGILADAEYSFSYPEASFGGSVVFVGTGNKKLVIKKVNKNHDESRIRLFTEFQFYLNTRGIPCSKIFKSLHDQLYIKKEYDYFYLQERSGGASFWWPDLPDQDKKRLIKKFAGILGALHRFSIEEFVYDENWGPKLKIEDNINQINNKLALMPYSKMGSMGVFWFAQRFPSPLRQKLKRLLPTLPHIVNCIKRQVKRDSASFSHLVLTHGDWNHENLLIKDGSILGVIDFDNAIYLVRSYDIGSACAIMCYMRNYEDVFLAEYENCSGLAPPDFATLRVSVMMRLLNSLLWQILHYRYIKDPSLRGKAVWWINKLVDAVNFEVSEQF